MHYRLPLDAELRPHVTAADSLGGEAMLVGIEFPTAGCWQLTAEYRDAVLSYVVWIKDQ